MTTKQQHVSRFLEASLLRQAEGKLKNTLCNVCKNEACVNCGTLNATTLIWLSAVSGMFFKMNGRESSDFHN